MSSQSDDETTPFLRDRKVKTYYDDDEDDGSSTTTTTTTTRTTTVPDEKLPFPKSVFFIFSNETCERFSFYGMKAVLSLYLSQLLMQVHNLSSRESEDWATLLFHTFLFLTYLTPLIGALLADSFIGKFKTILYLSVVYAIGQAVLSLGAVPNTSQGILGLPQEPLSFVGLVLVALGTGGIKPCVVALGADQFRLPAQKAQMAVYFSIFYACINLGSMFSSFLTPIFRNTPCLGDDQCYVLAFGVPAILMFVSIIFFVCGRPYYRVLKPSSNVVAEFFGCIAYAVRSPRGHNEHWLDSSIDMYGPSFVKDVKAVLHVCLLFITFPLYWALFDQQGSRWTFQATMMDGRITETFELLPDQMTVVNTILVLVFIPLFTFVVYPLLSKLNILTKPLQRIVSGGVLVGLAFIVSALLEVQLQKGMPHPPTTISGMGESELYSARLAIHASLPSQCSINFDMGNDHFGLNGALNGGQSYVVHNEQDQQLLPILFNTTNDVILEARFEISNCTLDHLVTLKQEVVVKPKQSTTLWLTLDKKSLEPSSMLLYQSHFPDAVAKPETVGSYVRFLYNLDEESKGGEVQLRRLSDQKVETSVSIDDKLIGDTSAVIVSAPVKYEVCLMGGKEQCSRPFEVERGGSFNVFVSSSLSSSSLLVELEVVASANSIHLLWMVPQYALLTAGEVLFSITSLSFAFTQAPKRMKSVVQALYLLTNAVGNLVDIVAIATLSSLFGNQVLEFLFFAVLMFLDMAILTFLASRYKYVDYDHDHH